ncbi:MAG: type II secretion system protein GspC [Pseudomonadota bacterium]
MEIAQNFKGLVDSPDKAIATANRYGPPVVTALLVAAIGWLLASLTLLLLPRPAPESPPVQAPRPAARDAGPADINVNAIVQRHLFGVAPVKPIDDAPAPGSDDDDLDETTLRLTLLGTLATDDADRSLAIIESGNDAKVYSIGDTIQSGVTLDRVRAKDVTIVNRGKREILPLPREDEGAGTRATTRTASRPSRSTSRAAPSRQAPIQQAQSLGARSLSDLIRPQPVFANGKQRGYRVYPGRQRDQFTALGLKAGDLVTEINGTPLDDPTRGKDVFASLASASQISVTIERNGSPVSLVLDTSQINLNGN